MSVFDNYYHYDSACAAIDEDKLSISIPKETTYWISVSNIKIQYTGGPPDTLSGFLVINDTEGNQPTGLCKTGLKMVNKVVFPLTNPGTDSPSSNTYNKILLRTSDTIKIKYYDNTFTEVPTTRIVATVRISDSVDLIRQSCQK